MLKNPLHGVKVIAALWAICFLLISAFAAPNLFAKDIDQDVNLREIDSLASNISNNVDLIKRLFAANQSNLAVSGSMREIIATVNEMDEAAGHMLRIYDAFTNNTHHDATIQEFIAALDQLLDGAHKLQSLLRPIGIRPAQNEINLRDVIFALNNIVDNTLKLKRILNAIFHHRDNSGNPADIPQVEFEDLIGAFRHVVTNIHKVQTLSYQIDPDTKTSPEVIGEFSSLLHEASDWMGRFERLLRAYGLTIDEHLKIIRRMVEISDEVQIELNRLMRAILPFDRLADSASGMTVDLSEFQQALGLITSELRQIRRGLKVLSGEAPSTDPIGDPADITPVDSTLARFDLNNNCVIDNEEIIKALELWISKQISKRVFMQVVDAWVSGTAICDAAATFSDVGSSSTIELKTRLSSHSAYFQIKVQNVTSTKIEIFNSSGLKIHTQQTQGTKLMWNLRNEVGQRVANGVYFYALTYKLKDGTAIRDEIKKIVILR